MNTRSNSRHFIVVTFLLLVGFFTAMAPLAIADETAGLAGDAKRPKVCLVLSGGGARGAAHVGVLKVLEEYRVPIDCIVGTSMGSLVGAAYASGTSVADMEKLMAGLSTNTLFRDAPPREELQIRRKLEDRSLLFSPEVGVGSKKGHMLPQGFVSGVQLETVLRAISAPGYHDFNKLPIPYRAVATDLVTGKAAVFDKGELANVMRSSMSVPVAIAPIEIDGKLLVDGMLVNNLPVDVAQAMDADIIIAVNVGTPLLKREELGSILGVAGQMLSILTEQNVQTSLALLKPTDILISPELGDFATSDFDHLPSTIPIGEAAARKVKNQLSALSLSPEQYAAYRNGLSKIAARDYRPVDKIRFKNLERVDPEYLASLMDTKPGREIKQEELDKDLRKLYGTSDFEHVNYDISEENGQRILTVDAIEKSWGPNYFRFGLGLEHNFSGDSNFTLEGLVRKTWINSLGAEWITNVKIGDTDSILSQFYQPIDSRHRYFVAPFVEARRSSNDLYLGNDHIATYDSKTYQAGVELGRDIAQYGQVKVGIRAGVIEPSLDIGPRSLSPSEDSISIGAFTATLQLDKLNSVTFPTDGWLAYANLYNSTTSLGAEDNYTKWEVRGNYVKSFGSHTFNIGGVANGSMSDDLPFYAQNYWGGFLRMSGLAFGQLTGESLTYGRFLYYNKLVDYQMFDGVYAGFSLEAGKMRNPLVPGNSDDLIKSASVFVATDSPVGPVYLGYGHADNGDNSTYLFLGLPY